ncbi:MAG TPA: undecaprenyl-diphosphate phosphatase [Chitinophagales bacterium]
MTTFEAVILAVVEGLTEFLPVSSTGHMILTQGILQIENSDFAKTFLINIQFGAILAVLVMYFKRFFQTLEFYKSLFIAFIPAAVLGFLLNDFIDSLLESVPVVAVSLIVGGFVLIWADQKFKNQNTEDQSSKSELPTYPTIKQSLIIGLAQCVAMIPGVSRSASTIIGGLSQKLTFKKATEYSFFLAVPTIFAAAAYKTLKAFKAGNVFTSADEITMLLIGNAIAFVVAILAIKFFIDTLNKYGLRIWGYYRIVVGVIILIAIYVLHLPLEIPS